ncbi:hypothetical protein G4L39_05580 [Limisphaera ngatamarikiensis]|uniref:Uncharacterized protein n=1 Tax=Limisphaera ngatamarikiensis TaxID=1324935 RepID=A0A6M1RGW9_9BACT|nr:hypothetical protein [Limisphaera ngatamarikiensis]NGO38866.1 hypothetical protein [Limisphaera ngatamarikiensis]
MTVDDFKPEMEAAIRAYDRFVVCLERPTQDFERSLRSLVARAIQAYQNRGPGMRHGIALDKHVTVILSVSDTERPLCGIYFNLHSPYHGKPLPKTVKEIHPRAPESGGSGD